MYKILIIDDQESIIDMLKRRLAKYDYTIFTCLSIEAAIKILQTEKMDVLLTDYMMPEVSGFDFFQTFENKKDIPVIMMTAYPSVNLVTEFIKIGGADFIEKPIDIDVLHMKIQRAVYNYSKLSKEKELRIEAENKLKLSYEALKVKSELLEMANSQMEAFAGVVAHDLKSPLVGQNILVGYLLNKAKSIGNDFIDEFCVENLSTIKDSCEEMSLLVEALLEFSKLQSKGFSLQQVNTNSIVANIINTYKSNEKLIFKIDSLHEVKCEPTLIKQVFTNLIQNAIKYSASREIQHLEINSKQSESEVIFSVKDNGIGFKMENANAIFSMFTRLEKEEQFEGTGIGLAIVKNIIDRHFGKIWVESVPDKGSCFHFSIPI